MTIPLTLPFFSMWDSKEPPVGQIPFSPRCQRPVGEDFPGRMKPYWLGRQMGPKELQCAEWCHRAEQYALQNLHEPRMGRGWYLAIELKPLPQTAGHRSPTDVQDCGSMWWPLLARGVMADHWFLHHLHQHCPEKGRQRHGHGSMDAG